MQKLRFPIFKRNGPPERWLSMDDYLKFVVMNLKFTVKDKEANKEWRELLAVNVPFRMR